jgi:hypothetical protein
MAREAAVRLTLSNAQFVTSIKRAGDVVQDVSRKGKRGMDAFGASADAVKGKIAALGGATRTAMKYAASLGGLFTMGNAIRGAVQLQRSYRQIAFGVREANGQMLRAADVQKLVERTAAATGNTNESMAQSFRDILEATGDLDFSRKVLGAVGTTATATGAELSTVGELADQMHTKFGVSADGMLDAMAQVVDAAKQGGPNFNQYAEAISGVGAELLAAGVKGKKGLDFMLGALVATDDEFKSIPKQVAGLKAVFRGLSEGGELKKIGEKIGIDPKKLINEKDALARLRRILSTGKKGAEALVAPLHEGEEKRTMEILFTNPFKKALADAERTGLKGQAAIDAALVVFDKGLDAFGKAGMDGAALARRAEEERRSPEGQLTAALNRLNTAFGQPVIIKAIDDLAAHLPQLAEVVAQVVGFAANHPILAGGAAIGGNVVSNIAGEAIGGGAVALGGKLLKKMFGKGAVGAATSAAGGAAELAASGIQRYQQFGMAGGITGEMLGAAPAALGAGEAAAAGIAAPLGAGLSALVLPLVAAAAAATMGVGIHRLGVEGDASKELGSATAAGFGGGSRKEKAAALERLLAARKTSAETETGEGGLDWLIRSFGGIDSRKGAQDQLRLADEAIEKLRASLAGAPGAKGGGGPVVLPETNIVGRVKVDQEGSRMIGASMATALGGQILTVRIANPREVGIPVSSGGGSRGPMAAGTPRPGGAV